MNKFDFGSMPVRGGFLAFYRMVHHSQNFILRDGKHDIIFATSAEAEKAAGEAFKEYLNSPISGLINATAQAAESADSIFVGLKPFVRQKGGKLVQVERRRQA